MTSGRIITPTILSSPSKVAQRPVAAMPISGYISHFDADELPYADGVKVPQLHNLTGNAAVPSITQVTASNQPIIGTEAGHRHLFTNGANCILFNPTAITAIPQSFTRVVVAKATSTGNASIVGASTNANVGINTSKWFMNAGTTLFGPAIDTNWHIFIAVFNGASSVFYVDGIAYNGNAGTNSLAQIRLFSNDATNYIQGYIRKDVIYPGVLTLPQVQRTYSYLASRYAI